MPHEARLDAKDPTFEKPSKPIGPVYSAADAAQVASDHGWAMVTEAIGGGGRVVPSPLPLLLQIIGLGTIKGLLEAGHTVIYADGGSIRLCGMRTVTCKASKW